MIELAPRIVVDENVCFGKPVVRGTRVPVALVLGLLAGGEPIDRVMGEYDLDREDVLACLAYAANVVATSAPRSSE